jgi:hypothetical protein
MPTKKSLLTSLKGKKMKIHTSPQNSAIDLSPIDHWEMYSHIITNVEDELFEAKTAQGRKEYFSIAHVRRITL